MPHGWVGLMCRVSASFWESRSSSSLLAVSERGPASGLKNSPIGEYEYPMLQWKRMVHIAKQMICSLLQLCKMFLVGVCFCFQSLELCIKRQPENQERLPNWKENQLTDYGITFSLIQMPQKLLWVFLIIKFVSELQMSHTVSRIFELQNETYWPFSSWDGISHCFGGHRCLGVLSGLGQSFTPLMSLDFCGNGNTNSEWDWVINVVAWQSRQSCMQVGSEHLRAVNQFLYTQVYTVTLSLQSSTAW